MVNIRDEVDADVGAITEVTVAAFNTLAISNHTEQFVIEALRAANALTLSLVLPLNVLIVIPAAILLWTQGGDPGWGLESLFRFGEPYRRYRANVPRGIPRRSVWQSS